MYVVSIDITGEEFQASLPEALWSGPYDLDISGASGAEPNYTVTPDGERILMIKQSGVFEEGRRPEINVVLDWFEELTERVPVP